MFTYASDGNEPSHAHVGRDDGVAKFWLDPVRLQRTIGFRAMELRQIQRLIGEHRDELMEAWDGYFHG